MVYKIYKSNNYIIIIDENDNYFEEHCANVLVTKLLTPSTTYDITFFRPENIPQAFYGVEFANIRQQSGAPYASPASWEVWYTTNTGLCSNNVVLQSILATLQAQTEVEGQFVRDTGNFDKVVLQVRVWDQDSQTYIATYYYNADASLYTPVGPLEWVGTAGAVTADITGPLGVTTDCADAVAITYCSAQATEFFDQGTTLDDILTELTSGTLDVNVTNTSFDVNVTNANIAVTQDPASSPWVIDATDLDIRSLDCTTDSVAICDGAGNALAIDGDGHVNTNLYANDLSTGAPEFLTSTSGSSYQALDVNQVPFVRTPNIISPTSGTVNIAASVYSITFSNVGTDIEQITFDAGANYVSILPGVSITMDAGGNNKYAPGVFGYDIQGSGPLLIVYNS